MDFGMSDDLKTASGKPASRRKDGKVDGRYKNTTPKSPGRTKGTKDRAGIAMTGPLTHAASKLARKAVEMALAGDTTALRLCLDRIYPVPKGRTVKFTLGETITPQNLPAAYATIIQRTAAGEITPTEAADIMKALDAFKNAVVAAELEARVADLEKGSN